MDSSLVQLHRLRKYVHNNNKYKELFKYTVNANHESYDTIYRKITIDHVVKQKLQKILNIKNIHRLFHPSDSYYYQYDFSILGPTSGEFQVIDLNTNIYYVNVWDQFCDNSPKSLYISSQKLQPSISKDKDNTKFEIDYIYVLDVFEIIDVLVKNSIDKIKIMYDICSEISKKWGD